MDWAVQLQRVVNLATQEAAEYEKAQRLDLLQPALESLRELGGQQQPATASFAPQQQQQRANVLLRPLAAAGPAAAEQAVQDAALAVAGAAADTANAGQQHAPATGGMLPTPALVTPAALLQTPANSAAWAALRPADAAATLGLTPAVTLAGAAGVRSVAAFPHFLSGVMATPMLQQRLTRPGEQQPGGEADDGKTSKKRQGYHIEPAALQKLIEKQQVEAQRKQHMDHQHPAPAAHSSEMAKPAAEAEAAVSAAAAAAIAAGHPDEPPPRQQLQQHRPRVLSRLPPQVREQAERQAAERARKQQEGQQGEAAGDSAGSSRQQSGGTAGTGAAEQQQQPLTAADCLESPNGSLGGLRLPGGELDAQAQGLDLGDIEAGKLFGSAQKRLRLSLCDENGSLLPGGQPLFSPVVLPTPSPAIAATAPSGALAASGSSTAAPGHPPSQAAPSTEAPTPSKFFSGSPVPQTERRPALHREQPDTPVALGQPLQHKQDVKEALLEPLRAAAAQGTDDENTGGGGSSWVPVLGQAPAVLGATPVPAGPPGCADAELQVLDAAAAAAMPVPESPVKQMTVGVQQGAAGPIEGGAMLQTPEGQEQQVAATPVTGL